MRKKISIAILLCLLMITVTGCGTKKDNVLSTSEVKIESLKKYENSKLADNKAYDILKKLPGELYIDKVQRVKDSNDIEVEYAIRANDKDEYANFWENPQNVLQKNSAILFTLIDDLVNISFKVGDIDKKSYNYSRTYIESVLGQYMDKMLEDEETWNKFNELKVMVAK